MASHKHQTSHQQPIIETEKYSLYFPKQYKGISVKRKITSIVYGNIGASITSKPVTLMTYGS